MAVVVPKLVFLYLMLEITPEHTANDVHRIVREILSEFGLDNIRECDIVRALNEVIELDDLSEDQKRKFLH